MCRRTNTVQDSTFTHIGSGVSLPYMNIRKALAEMHRVLVPNGTVYLSVHRLSFTLAELRDKRTLRGILGRLSVILNGLWLHFLGFQFRGESFQTKHVMLRELRRAGFTDIAIVKEWPLAFTCRKSLSCRFRC